ncbi:aromatic amino acid ammonia-lyase [Streptomyces arboris]|uniref:aromatic amino acid ammonia-lyase n=1 Tax=Streptomyces arboris TaxID=2600619 RepID=UPI001CEFA248|nr:aromatic amino acid ammonia-lyase [Streptomyces arboris]
MIVDTEDSPKVGLADLLSQARPGARLDACDAADAERMREGVTALDELLAAEGQLYGITQGFGPLVVYPAAGAGEDQGSGLIAHLASAQGRPLPPEVSRLVVWLRLNSIRKGHSAVAPEFWDRLADLWNRGFTPVIPRDGTVSASGDLQPLAHAALALTGEGEAWQLDEDGGWSIVPAAEALAALGAEPITWRARESLSFVNGTSVGLAATMFNHRELLRLSRAVALLTSRAVTLLGSSPQAYHPAVGHIRGQTGQILAAQWIRDGLPPGMRRAPHRPLQEPYSLRCAPQVIGAVLDQLSSTEQILVREATGCTDNPLYFEGEFLHAGNFHAMPVGLASDQIGLCLQQIAFLAERQLALLCTPATNGDRPPMLTPNPGSNSGLAGVQLSATSFVSRIRQLVYPSGLTSLPTNGWNQDHVPMALNGANSVGEALELAWLVVGSLGLGVTQFAAIEGREPEEAGVWAELARVSPPLSTDRPLAAEVRAARDILAATAADLISREEVGDDGHTR